MHHTELLRRQKTPARAGHSRQDVQPYYDMLRSARQRLTLFPNETMTPEELVSEAWLKLYPSVTTKCVDSADRFQATASLAMKQILIDRYRASQTAKRGAGARHLPLEEAHAGCPSKNGNRVDINFALERLQDSRPNLLQVVLLRALGGMTCQETARICQRSLRSTERDWRNGRNLLQRWLPDYGQDDVCAGTKSQPLVP